VASEALSGSISGDGPIISIFSNSVSLTMMDAMLSGGKDGAFTYKYVDRVFTSSISEKIFWTPLKNSITVSFFP